MKNFAAASLFLSILCGCGPSLDSQLPGFWESPSVKSTNMEFFKDGRLYHSSMMSRSLWTWKAEGETVTARSADGKTEFRMTIVIEEDGMKVEKEGGEKYTYVRVDRPDILHPYVRACELRLKEFAVALSRASGVPEGRGAAFLGAIAKDGLFRCPVLKPEGKKVTYRGPGADYGGMARTDPVAVCHGVHPNESVTVWLRSGDVMSYKKGSPQIAAFLKSTVE